MTSEFHVLKVVSGGQTGVDQAALRAARSLGIKIGGWCPPGRQTEDGRDTIPREFQLNETPREFSDDAPDVPRSLRTEWNVRDSDATLILRANGSAKMDAGTRWTALCAVLHFKPTLTCNLARRRDVARARKWIEALKIKTLNVAGASEKAVPGIGQSAERFLTFVLQI